MARVRTTEDATTTPIETVLAELQKTRRARGRSALTRWIRAHYWTLADSRGDEPENTQALAETLRQAGMLSRSGRLVTNDAVAKAYARVSAEAAAGKLRRPPRPVLPISAVVQTVQPVMPNPMPSSVSAPEPDADDDLGDVRAKLRASGGGKLPPIRSQT